jgi:hypothetical protein
MDDDDDDDDDDSSEQDKERDRKDSAFRPVTLRPKKDWNLGSNSGVGDADADLLPSLESSASTSPAEQQPPPPFFLRRPTPAMVARGERGAPLLPNTPEAGKPLKHIHLNFKVMKLEDE